MTTATTPDVYDREPAYSEELSAVALEQARADRATRVAHIKTLEHVPVDALREYPGNARIGDVDAIADSMDENGVFAPIIVQRSTDYVLDGNHRLKAMQQLGMEEVPVVYVDVDDERAKRIVLVANRTNDLASYDDAALAELLQSLPDLTATGYDADDLEDLLAQLKPASLDDLEDEFGEPEETDLWPKIIVQVPHHIKDRWEDVMGSEALNHLPEHERLLRILDGYKP